MIPSKLGYHASLMLSLIVFCTTGCGTQTADKPADVETGTVTVKVTWPNAKTETVKVPDVVDGTTLESVMRQIDSINLNISGTGTTAFVRSIGGTATSESDGWTFTIDGEFAMQGIGSTELHPPTAVEWKFGGFESAVE